MIEYKGQLNMGNEALGTEKTITANESLRTCDMKALARGGCGCKRVGLFL